MRSIRRHLLRWLLGALTLSSLALAAVLYLVTLEEMNEVFDEQLKQVALTVLTHYDGTSDPAAAAKQHGDLEDYAFVTQVWSVQGQRLFAQVPDTGIPFSRDEGFGTVQARGGRWRVYTDRSANYLIQAAQPMEARYELAADIALKFLIASLAAVPLLGLFLVIWLDRGLQPVTQAAGQVERRSAVSLEPIATETLPRELQPLVAAVNALMAKLSAALAAQREFIADAAHELRTPLTALRLQVQLLLLATDEPARREAADDIRHGLVRATHLVEQLLNLSRVEPDAAPRAHEPVDLAALVRTAAADFSARADALGIDLGADIERSLERDSTVVADAEQLRVLLNNLVDNALRHTPAGGRVDLGLHAGADPLTLRLAVSDSGPGIPDAERARVFDRFYRGSSAHGPQGSATGAGLGLAIVKAVADKHGARLEVGDGIASPQSGTTGLSVTLTLRRTGLANDRGNASPLSPP